MASIAKRLIRWCFVSREDPDEGDFPVQQVSYMGKVTDSVAWYPYGFHAVAELDALGVMLNQQGDTHLHLVGSPRERITVGDGEVIVYHPDTGSKVHFKSNGDIDVESPGTLSLNGETLVTIGELNGAVQRLVDERFAANYDNHVHWNGGDSTNRNTSGPEDGSPNQPSRGSASPILVGTGETTVITKAS
jgi:hypothetical protein